MRAGTMSVLVESEPLLRLRNIAGVGSSELGESVGVARPLSLVRSLLLIAVGLT